MSIKYSAKDALELCWPILRRYEGAFMAPDDALALTAAAEALGKKIVLEPPNALNARAYRILELSK